MTKAIQTRDQAAFRWDEQAPGESDREYNVFLKWLETTESPLAFPVQHGLAPSVAVRNAWADRRRGYLVYMRSVLSTGALTLQRRQLASLESVTEWVLEEVNRSLQTLKDLQTEGVASTAVAVNTARKNVALNVATLRKVVNTTASLARSVQPSGIFLQNNTQLNAPGVDALTRIKEMIHSPVPVGEGEDVLDADDGE